MGFYSCDKIRIALQVPVQIKRRRRGRKRRKKEEEKKMREKREADRLGCEDTLKPTGQQGLCLLFYNINMMANYNKILSIWVVTHIPLK